MLIKETTENLIKNKELFNDRYRYSLLLMIINDQNSLKLTNQESSIIIAQTNTELPIWIFNTQDVSSDAKKEVVNFVVEHLKKEKFDTIVCTKEMLEAFDSSIIKSKIGMFGHINPNPYCHKESIGSLSRVKEEEINLLASYLVQEAFEIWNKEVSIVTMKDRAKKLMEDSDFYVWRDEDQTMASFGKLNRDYPGIIRINNVFTSIDKRKKGFAGILVYRLTKMVLEEGCMPMLFTDKDYLPSNRCYQNIGYQIIGELVEVCFNKEGLNG